MRKGCFTYDDEVMMKCKARVILSVAEVVNREGLKCVIGFICVLWKESNSLVWGLRGRLELTEFSSGMKLSGIALMCAAKRLSASATTFVFPSLVFYFEVIGLNRENPTNNTVSSGGGEFQRRVDKELGRKFVVRFD